MRVEEIPNPLKPGIYLDIEDRAVKYFENTALSNSDMKNLLISPAIYWKYCNLNPAKEKDIQTDPMALGDAHHCLLLTPEIFHKRYIVVPGDKWMKGDRRRVVNRIDYNKMKAAVDVIRKDPRASVFVNREYGYPEVTVIWPDPTTGILCKAKHDFFSWDTTVDFKSPANLTDSFLINQCRRLRYPMQNFHYLEGRIVIREMLRNGTADFYGDFSKGFMDRFVAHEGEDVFWFLFQMRDEPHAARMWEIDEDSLLYDGEQPVLKARGMFKDYIEKHGLEPWPVGAVPFERVSLRYGVNPMD